MEVIAALNKVTNYQDFVLITEKIKSPNSLCYSSIPLNISLLQNLKKIIEFERRASIQDLGKNFIQSNFAVFVSNAILKSEVQCVWEDIAAPIVSLLQFNLIQYIEFLKLDFSRWWNSLRIVISSLSELCSRHISLQNLILSQLSEIILKLVCDKSLPLYAVKHVIKTFNICSLNSKRQLRSKLCLSLQEYFSQIAQSIATCGDFDTQLAYVQTLLRWLVRRSDKEVRVDAARIWFSSSLFPHEARQIFVERKFENFDLDCRDFLNAVNHFSGLVTSVDAESIQMGKIKLKEIEQNKKLCLDINCGCISIYCDATSFCDSLLKNYQFASQWETIIIMPDIVYEAQLKREGKGPVLSLHLEKEPEYQLPTSKMMILENYKMLHIRFDESEELKQVSVALKRLFGSKYTVQQNINHLFIDPAKNQNHTVSECFIGTFRSPSESAKLSNADCLHSDNDSLSVVHKTVSKKYQKRSSYLSDRISGRNLSSEKKVSRILFRNSAKRELAFCGTSPSLPSTTSTASLLRLGENLQRYQQVNYDKRMDYLAQSPSLSNITEETNVNALSVQSSYNNLLAKQNESAKAKLSSIKFNQAPNCNGNNRSVSPVSSDNENFRSLLSLIVDENGFNIHPDVHKEAQNLHDDLLKEATAQKPVVLLTKLRPDEINKCSRETTPTGLFNNKIELEENFNAIRKQNEYHNMVESENKDVYSFEETGSSDVISETQKHCNQMHTIKSNIGKKVKKKVVKQTYFAKNKSDDSGTNDVIEATPFVNKERVQRRKKNIPKDSISEHTEKQLSEETLHSLTIDKHVIDDFFDNHFVQVNKTVQVSPNTARIINETTSGSDSNEPTSLIENEISKPSEALADNIMQTIKECLADIITKITEEEVKKYRGTKMLITQHSALAKKSVTNTTNLKPQIERLIDIKDASSNISNHITKLNNSTTPIITNKRRKLYSPSDNFQCEENSNNVVSQNDDLVKVKPPDVYSGSASEQCRGKKPIRKKYLMSESDDKTKSANNGKGKAKKSKTNKCLQKSRKPTSDHKILSSKFSNFIETNTHKNKEAVYNLSSDSDEFEYKNNTRKVKIKHHSRSEVRKSKIPTKHGRLVKACNYAETDTVTSANDSSLSRDNSRSRVRKSLSLKHHNDIINDEKMRKDSRFPEQDFSETIAEVNDKNVAQDDDNVIPKIFETKISMEEQTDNDINDNVFSKITSPQHNSVHCVGDVQLENTTRVTSSKLQSSKSRKMTEKTKVKRKKLSKNKRSHAKDLDETKDSLPPLIIETVGNKRNDDKLDDLKSLTIEKIKNALNRPAETTLDDLQSDVNAMINENTYEVVDSDVIFENHSDNLHKDVTNSKEINTEKEESNVFLVKETLAEDNIKENVQVVVNNDNVIQNEVPVNNNLLMNAQMETNINIQKMTENIVGKDSVNQMQEIITITDSNQSIKETKSGHNLCISENRQIEEKEGISMPIPTSIIYISDDEAASMNNAADISLNTMAESPIRAHIDTSNDLPLTLVDLHRSITPRQFSDRSNKVSPEQVLENRIKRLSTSRRFFTGGNLWSESSNSSEEDFSMYMRKKPKLWPTLAKEQNVNKREILFCNTPEKIERRNGSKSMETSSDLLCNLSALTAHISPIKLNFSMEDTENHETQNELLNVSKEPKVINEILFRQEESTSNNCNNDILYKSTNTSCHISPIKFSTLLLADIDSNLSSDDSVNSPVRKKTVLTPFGMLVEDTERDSVTDCAANNNNVNNLIQVELPKENIDESNDSTSDTNISMRSDLTKKSSMQPVECKSDLKSRWELLEAQLAHISETDAQLESRFKAFDDCFKDIVKLKEQRKLQNAKIKEDILDIRKLLYKVLDT